MKAIYCGACGDFVALQDEVRSCKCRTVHGRWYDGAKGQALVAETERYFDQVKRDLAKEGAEPECAWILGIDNALLHGAHSDPPRGPNYLEYRDWQNAHGTLFKTYETLILRVRPGESSDTRFVSVEALVSREWPR